MWLRSWLTYWSTFPSSELPNFWIREQMSDLAGSRSDAARSAPSLVRWMSSSTPVKTFSIWSSSSVRSVTMSTRPSAFLSSRIHFASHTIVRLLPLPWVCQMIPPSRRRAKSCASFTPKYWL